MVNPITQEIFGKWHPVIGKLHELSGKQKTLHGFKTMKGC
jgi:hypothetical protein